MSTDFANKRSSARFSCHVPVDGKPGSPLDGIETIDVSKDGIGFLSSNEFAINQKIAIELALAPDEDPTLVLGVVKWVRPMTNGERFRIGLKFEMVLSGSQKELDSNLNHRFNDRGIDFADVDVDEL